MSDDVSSGAAAAGTGDSQRRRDLQVVVTGATILGMTSILYDLSGTSPATGAFFRCLYALIPLVIVVLVQRRRPSAHPSSGGWVIKAVVAGVFLGIDLVLWHEAIHSIGAGLSTVLLNLQVVFVAILGYVVLRQRITRELLTSMPLLFVGVALVAGMSTSLTGANPAVGASFAVIAAGAYAVYIFMMGLATRAAGRTGLPMLVSTAATGATAGLFGVVTGTLDLAPPLAAQGWLILLALVSQVVGWLLVASASQRLPAGNIAASLVLQSASALLFGAVLLSQIPSIVQIVGAVLILAGVVVATRQPAVKSPTPGVGQRTEIKA
ncbi:DMT family transporter [Rhodococcus sp. IEGM 1379]|uniref:DMT family transporter n=1 Tax=Rhodococcus sp. IEGM 1379 TaxID=3047086 RepID=UPI0024B7BBD7|nr:DMT family transporter [Rhodococcus sp. IEGM 1379]MDI9917159.1 DMT family transporter [Rhodococcus sp. IEGM 1379]